MKIALIGKNSQLGIELIKLLPESTIYFDSKSLNLSNINLLKNKLFAINERVNVLINCAAFNDVDLAENSNESFKINSIAVKEIAKFCSERNILLIHISTDNVFDGTKGNYVESDHTNPINQYGKSKLEGENNIINFCNNFIIIRTSWLYSINGKNSFLRKILDKVDSNPKEMFGVDNIYGSPTSALSLANAIVTILENDKTFSLKEIFHFSNHGNISRYDFIKEILINIERDDKIKLINVKDNYFKLPAKRPQHSNLISKKFSDYYDYPIPDWKNELIKCIKN